MFPSASKGSLLILGHVNCNVDPANFPPCSRAHSWATTSVVRVFGLMSTSNSWRVLITGTTT
eukprot:1148539-Pelagomonas_calceolata.AAC.2